MATRPPFKQEKSFADNHGLSIEMKALGPGATPKIKITGDGNSNEAPSPGDEGEEQDRFHSTFEDNKDMYRMNKAQELQRNFRFLSIFGYSIILGNGWVLALVGVLIPLTNGGTAGGIWGYFVVIFGLCFTTLSMAEMASMAPTAGGQYHWVSEFAPESCQRLLSYLTGWLCVLGWQTALCSSAYSGALAIQALVALSIPTYDWLRWHGVLLTIAVVLFTIVFNTVLLRRLPTFEGVMFTIHVFAFLAVLTVLWVMGDRANARQTFTEFSDFSGWGSTGVATLIGTLSASGSLAAADCAAHLAEEVKDAAWVVPRSMVVTAIFNYSFTWLMVITFMTVKGGTVEELLSSRFGSAAYVQIFENVTQSKAGTQGLTAIIFVLIMFGVINQVTTSSRQLFAFARDRGLPFSDFLGYVRPGWDIPLNAVCVTLLFSILVSLIILGSSVAFFTLGALCNSALYASYLIVIGCVAWRRIAGEPLLPSRFDLGKAGLPINITAMCFLSVQLVFIFFPTVPNPSPDTFNWSILVFGVVVVAAIVWYYVRGKNEYLGPVAYVRKTE